MMNEQARIIPNDTFHAYHIRLGGYLYVFIKGPEDNVEDSLKLWRDIAKLCNKLKLKRLLVEEDIEGSLSISDMYQFAAQLPLLGFKQIKVAFVDCHVDQHALNTFAENVAVNRGVNGKVFIDVDQARKWLFESE